MRWFLTKIRSGLALSVAFAAAMLISACVTDPNAGGAHPTVAQSTDPATDMDALDDDEPTPAAFVAAATQFSLSEVQLAQLAVAKSTNADVKRFATVMLRDFPPIDEQLASVAGSEKVAVPVTLDTEHAGTMNVLKAKSGTDFDVAYSRQVVTDHDKAITVFEDATGANDQKLVAFAQKTLPILQKHRQLAAALPTK